jgi:Arc/MetJ-type ribon-helix-helix transcriptional regulator
MMKARRSFAAGVASSAGSDMTVKPKIPLTDQSYAFVKLLVESGRFASVSGAIQYGILLLERQKAEQQARLDAIAADLERRAGGQSLSMSEMTARREAWRRVQTTEELSDLA